MCAAGLGGHEGTSGVRSMRVDLISVMVLYELTALERREWRLSS